MIDCEAQAVNKYRVDGPEIKLLGSRPDAEVARLIGRTVEGVSLKRQKLGIEAPLQPGWTEDEIKLLGRLPDAEVARRVKRSLTAVQIKRLLLGINRQRKAALNVHWCREWLNSSLVPTTPANPKGQTLGVCHPRAGGGGRIQQRDDSLAHAVGYPFAHPLPRPGARRA